MNYWSDFGNYMSDVDSGFSKSMFKLMMLVIFILSSLSCAFGYKIQKIYICICMAITFGMGGFLIVNTISDDKTSIAVLAALILMVVGGLLGFKIYKAMAVLLSGVLGFIIGGGLASLYSSGNIEESKIIIIIVGLFVGIVFGFIMYKIFKPIIIITTGLLGGFTAAYSFVAMFAYKGFYDFSYRASGISSFFGQGSSISQFWIPLGIILSIVGIIFQFKTAERKVSEFINELKSKTNSLKKDTNDDEKNQDPIETNNKILNALNIPITFPQNKNAAIYFLIGSIIAAVSVFIKGNDLISIIRNILISGILALLFTIYKNVDFKYKNMSINIMILTLLIFSGLGLIFMMINNGNFYSLLFNAGMGLFVASLWLAIAKNNEKPILFTASTSLLALYTLLLLFKGIFSFISIVMILAMFPFVFPVIKPFIEQMVNNAGNTQTQQTEASIEENKIEEDINKIE